MNVLIEGVWRNKWQIGGSLVALVAAVGVTAYLMQTPPEARRGARPPAQPRLVEVDTVRSGTHAVHIEAYGQVTPSRDVTLSPQLSGEIVRISDNFIPGGRLEKGELVARIDPANYELAVARAESQLETARANLRIEEGNQTVAQAEFAFLGEDLGPAERDLVLREPQLRTAKADVASARSSLEEARLDLARTEIRAPFDALVMTRDVNVGTRVTQQTTLTRLVGIHSYWVELAVPTASLRWIDEDAVAAGRGSSVRLTYEGVWRRNEFRTGRVVRILGDLTSEGRLARVLVEIPDPLALEDANKGKPRVLVGSYLKADIEGRPVENVFALDRSLVRDGNEVWVMTDSDRLEIRPVEIVYAGSGEVLVASGLADGDRVVATDIPTAASGMPLRIQQSEAPGAVIGQQGDEGDGTGV